MQTPHPRVLYCSGEDAFYKKLLRAGEGLQIEAQNIAFSGSPQKLARSRKAAALILKIKNRLEDREEQWLAQSDGSIPLIVISTKGTLSTAVQTLRYRIYDYFSMCQSVALITSRIKEAVSEKEPKQAVRKPEHGEVLLHGRNEEIRKINTAARTLARDPHKTVLLLGEPGTGKERLAYGIHNLSQLQDQPFVRYNCRLIQQVSRYDGIPASKFILLGLQELKKRHRRGLLFLQHLEQLDREQQSDVLDSSRGSAFRVIASIESPAPTLPEAITVLQIPALRQHSEDIPAIAEYLVSRTAKARGLQNKSLSRTTISLMQEYPWPGNVQELANVIDRMMILEPSEVLHPISWRISHGYGFRWKRDSATHLSTLIEEVLKTHEKTWEDGAVYEQFMANMKRMLIDLVLPRVDYNQMTAARILGISRNTLRDILRQTT